MTDRTRHDQETSMDRSLPILAVQAVSCTTADACQEFAADVRARVAAFPHTKLVVYPELHMTPNTDVAGMERSAEPIPGPRTDILCALAAELGVWLVPGSSYEREGSRIYNTALAVSPDGEIVARYRKCFPWRPWETTTPGDRFVVFDIPSIGRVGLSICYDTWFPEVARHLAWMGAEVILQPTLTPTADRHQEVVLARATAITNQVFVVNLNAAAPSANGSSLIVDPEGNVLVQAGEAPIALTQVIDLAAVDRVRHYGTAGLNRLWSQVQAEDPPLELPLYDGWIDAERWHPQRGTASPPPAEWSDPLTPASPARPERLRLSDAG
jgi:predicted amidohydrolase